MKMIIIASLTLMAGLMPAMAQMAPTTQSMRLGASATTPVAATTPPPANVPPVSNATAAQDATTPPIPAGNLVSTDYIWFGDDRVNEATRLLRGGRAIEALELLDKVTSRNMRLTEAHILKGVAYLQLKDLQRAEQAFNTALAVDRAYLGTYVYLAQIALLKQNTQQVEVYLQAIKTICLTEECAEYRFVKNALRGAAPATEDKK